MKFFQHKRKEREMTNYFCQIFIQIFIKKHWTAHEKMSRGNFWYEICFVRLGIFLKVSPHIFLKISKKKTIKFEMSVKVNKQQRIILRIWKCMHLHVNLPTTLYTLIIHDKCRSCKIFNVRLFEKKNLKVSYG